LRRIKLRNEVLKKLLEELEYDSSLIDLLECISSHEPKTVRELASVYKEPVPKIYRELHLLDSLQLVEIYDERPMKVKKILTDDVLLSLAQKAKEHLETEITRRLDSINSILKDYTKNHLSSEEFKVSSREKSVEHREKVIDHLEAIEPADLSKVLNYHKMLLEQETIMIIYPFELLNIAKETVIQKGIERFKQEFTSHSSIRETKVLILFFEHDIESIEDIFNFQ
jgi:hypothetical protein